jgi:glycosyltransferase involved in cell wall biosynthesis
MNILLGHKYFFRGGGTATYLFTLMRSLQQRGHKVVPLGVRYARCEPGLDTRYFIPPPCGDKHAFYAEIPRRPLPMAKAAARSLWSLAAFRQARRALREQQIDVAYLHNIYNYMSPSIIDACKREGVPVIMRVADHNLVCPAINCFRAGRFCVECLGAGPKRALRHRCVKGSLAATAVRVFSMYLHKWLGEYRRVDLFVAPSRWMCHVLIGAGYPPERVVHLPSFFPADGAGPQECPEEDYLLYFGRISREKGLDVLLRAYDALRPAARLVVAGEERDGEQRRLEAIVARMGTPAVAFVGPQSRQSLKRLIGGAMFTVVPSLQADNCPMAVLESFAMGRPVIGSRIGGLPEQIEGGCGLLFECGNAADLRAKMEWLLSHPEDRRQMGARAARRLLTIYREDKHCDRLLDLMYAVANGNGRQRGKAR